MKNMMIPNYKSKLVRQEDIGSLNDVLDIFKYLNHPLQNLSSYFKHIDSVLEAIDEADQDLIMYNQVAKNEIEYSLTLFSFCLSNLKAFIGEEQQNEPSKIKSEEDIKLERFKEEEEEELIPNDYPMEEDYDEDYFFPQTELYLHDDEDIEEDIPNESKSEAKSEKVKKLKTPRTKKSAGFTCYICREHYETQKLYDDHKKDHTECIECKQSFERFKDLVNHMKTNHKKPETVLCTDCGATFDSIAALKSHIRNSHAGTNFDTEIGKLKTPGTKKLAGFTCYICREHYASQKLYNDHKKDHKECLECNQSFERFKNLVNHMKTSHKKPETVLCTDCGATFDSIAALKGHIRNRHAGTNFDTETGKFKCPECGHLCNTKNTLVIHLSKKHRKGRVHHCPQCRASFFRPCDLKKHIDSIHKKIKSKVCHICARAFVELGALKKHISLIHDGRKDFECEKCDMKFSSKQSVKRHMVIHDGIKEHVCPECGKSFNQSTNLKVHLKGVHRKVIQFVCEICKSGFFNAESFKIHSEHVHKIFQ